MKYCTKCGKKCVEVITSEGFNEDTGEKIEYKSFFCPEINLDYSSCDANGFIYPVKKMEEGTFHGHNIYKIR
jgi:uncharacterized cysteine cluster protein YcgN (CxxCxxCC family)